MDNGKAFHTPNQGSNTTFLAKLTKVHAPYVYFKLT